MNTTPPAVEAQPTAMAGRSSDGPHSVPDSEFDTDSMLTATDKELHGHAKEEIEAAKKKLSSSTSQADKALVYKNIADVYAEHKEYPAAAYYYGEWSKLENSEKSLNFAGRFNLDVFHNAQTPAIKAWAVQNAITGFERSLELNSDNDTVKMALASAYVDGTNQPMQGIQLLLGITREEPNNVPANLMLGQMSIRSGQYDKAIGRFETVLEEQPENTEALYFLAEAYKNKGDKQKAIELLEQCKKIIDNPKFSNDIDEYIKSFK